MTKVIFISTAICSALILWLSKNSGVLTFNLFDYLVETYVVYVFIAIIFISFLIHLVINFIAEIFGLPRRIKNYVKDNTRHQREEVIVKIIENIYLCNKEGIKKNLKDLTQIHNNKIADIATSYYNKYLGEIQTYKASLLILCKYPELKFKSLMSLVKIAMEEGEWLLGCKLSKEAYQENASFESEKNYIITHFNACKYNELLEFVKKFKLNGCINKIARWQLQGLIYYKMAEEEIANSNFEQAERFLKFSIDHLPSFIPAVKMLFELKYNATAYLEALDVLKNAWKVSPNYYLNLLFSKLKNHFTVDEYYKNICKVVSYRQDHYESSLLLAEAALVCEQHDIAFQEISRALHLPCKKRATLLMAKFCLVTHRNASEVLEWLRQNIESKAENIETEFYLDHADLAICSVKPSQGSLIAKLEN